MLRFNVQKSTNDGVVGALVFVSIVSNFQVPLMSPLAMTLLRNAVRCPPIGIGNEAIVLNSKVADGAAAPRPPVGVDIDDAASCAVGERRTDQEPIIDPEVCAGDSAARDAGTTNGFDS